MERCATTYSGQAATNQTNNVIKGYSLIAARLLHHCRSASVRNTCHEEWCFIVAKTSMNPEEEILRQ